MLSLLIGVTQSLQKSYKTEPLMLGGAHFLQFRCLFCHQIQPAVSKHWREIEQ